MFVVERQELSSTLASSIKHVVDVHFSIHTKSGNTITTQTLNKRGSNIHNEKQLLCIC